MPRIRKSVIISAPVEKVFEYLSNPENMLEWQPNVTAIRDITGRGENQKWTLDYKMMGLHFTSQAKVTQSRLNTERRVTSTGGIESSWFWVLNREAGGTRLELEVEYTIPMPVLGKIGELIILHRNDRVADMAMTNIKERIEA